MLRFKKVKEVKSPERGTKNSAGIDFFIPDGMTVNLYPGESAMIPSGIQMDIPDGTMLMVCNKSGIAKQGLLVGACIVDSDYQGEMHLNVWNVSDKQIVISEGKKLVQMVHIPILLSTPTEIDPFTRLFEVESERGEGKFGSTGK